MIRSQIFRSVVLLISIYVTPFILCAQDRIVESETHQFVEVAKGVWHVSGNGKIHTMSNAMVLVGEFDTLVVDSHVTPSAARTLLDSLPVITDKPVRYLVNSHYHFDHAHGNQSFPSGIEIIGHEFTRAKLSGTLGNVLDESTFRSFSDPVPSLVASLGEQIASESDLAKKAELQERLRVQTDYMNAIDEVVPTPPNITLADKMTLFQVVPEGESRDTVTALWAGTHRRRCCHLSSQGKGGIYRRYDVAWVSLHG